MRGAVAIVAVVLAAVVAPTAAAGPIPRELFPRLREMGGERFARSAAVGWERAPYRDATRRYFWAQGYAFFDGLELDGTVAESCAKYTQNRADIERLMREGVNGPGLVDEMRAVNVLFRQKRLPTLDLRAGTLMTVMFSGIRGRCAIR